MTGVMARWVGRDKLEQDRRPGADLIIQPGGHLTMYIILLAGRDRALGTRQTTMNMTATVQWGREGHQGPGLAEVGVGGTHTRTH